MTFDLKTLCGIKLSDHFFYVIVDDPQPQAPREELSDYILEVEVVGIPHETLDRPTFVPALSVATKVRTR